jgi:plastocyanin
MSSVIDKKPAIAAVIIATMAASCGSGTPTSPSAGSHTVIATVMIEAAGPNPREMTIGVGEFVSFMNHERVPYTVVAGAVPSEVGCAELNAVGVLRPDDIRRTTPFSTAKTCDYHIRSGEAVLFSGRIVVR